MKIKAALFNVIVVAFVAGSSSALAASTQSEGKTKPADIVTQLGRSDFLTYCAACHGTGGKGDGTIAAFLTINAADLTQLKKTNAGLFPRERVTEVIDGRVEVKVHGPRDMPVWGDWFRREAVSDKVAKSTQEEFVAARISALVEYIESIQGN